ncbi:nicotinate phosphoribosyltransferase [Pseudocyphellaria aurata]|nr:nicotinate phosphoribosyltransferase [Pseudocyphellaria aurata]
MAQTRSRQDAEDLPDGISSLLDTDLYKLTMQCAILKYLPDVREGHIQIYKSNASDEIDPGCLSLATVTNQQYGNPSLGCQMMLTGNPELGNIVVTSEELEYLKTACSYLHPSYLQFLSSFRLCPSKQVQASFQISHDTDSEDDVGELSLDLAGKWVETILYETPLLALTSEAYFKFCDRDWNYDAQEEKAYAKGTRLMENGCIFLEFGTRRRRDYHTQDLVLQGLTRATATAAANGWSGKLSGSSNVHFAMKYGIPPLGTVAHEWFMGIASIKDDYEHANESALRYWVDCYGEGVLGIVLTDTFGTPNFLKAFKNIRPSPARAEQDATLTRIPGATPPSARMPDGDSNGYSEASEPTDVPISSGAEHDSNGQSEAPEHTEANGAEHLDEGRSYAQIFAGVRQDSGDPLTYIKMMRDFYDSQGIKERKTIVFSDSLNVERCIEYMHAANDAGFSPSFGVGTFLTNDFMHQSCEKKSVPMNIVIKLSSANGRPAVKISDNIGKTTGDSETVHNVKVSLGYIEKTWVNGDETTRWGAQDDEATTASVQA